MYLIKLTIKRRIHKFIKKLCNKKNVLHGCLKNTGGCRAEYDHTCKTYKKAVLQNSIQIKNGAIHSTNRKQFFKYTSSKTLIHFDIPSLRNENGDLETQDNTKAEILNHFLSSIFTKNNNNKPVFKSRVLT